MTLNRPRRLALIAVAAAALTLLATGWALATHFGGHVTSSGKAQVSQTNQSSSAFASITSTTFSTLNGTSTTVVVPSGQTRLVNARWVGEAMANGGTCFMRMVAFLGTGPSGFELNPVDSSQVLVSRSGSGFETEAQAVERSRVLGSGTWTVVAQVKRNTGVTCSVDDWHFAVQVIAT